jgi:hypothetical protein
LANEMMSSEGNGAILKEKGPYQVSGLDGIKKNHKFALLETSMSNAGADTAWGRKRRSEIVNFTLK